MNIYSVKAYGHYGGGMAVVCAASESDAREVAGAIRDEMWRTDYARGEALILIREVLGPARVLDHFETGE